MTLMSQLVRSDKWERRNPMSYRSEPGMSVWARTLFRTTLNGCSTKYCFFQTTHQRCGWTTERSKQAKTLSRSTIPRSISVSIYLCSITLILSVQGAVTSTASAWAHDPTARLQQCIPAARLANHTTYVHRSKTFQVGCPAHGQLQPLPPFLGHYRCQQP